MELAKQEKQKIIQFFEKKPEIAAVYLYGSQAKGYAHPDSDIDLAVLVTDHTNYTGFGIVQVVLAQELEKLLKKKVDVADLDFVAIDFAKRILSEGEIFIGLNSPERIAFEEKVLREYFDMKPAIDEYLECLSEIARKGEIHVGYI